MVGRNAPPYSDQLTARLIVSAPAKSKRTLTFLLLCSLLLPACSSLNSDRQTDEQTRQQFIIEKAKLAHEAELTAAFSKLHQKEYLSAETALLALLEKTSQPTDKAQLNVALLLLYLDRKSPLYSLDNATPRLDQLFQDYNTALFTRAQQLQFHSLHLLLQHNIDAENETAQRQQEHSLRLRRESQIRVLEQALKKLRNLSLH